MAKKRAHGEGALFYDDKNSRWVAQIRLPNGKRKSKSGSTKKEVSEWLLAERNKLNSGLTPTDEKLTLGKFLDRFLQDVAEHTLKPSTLRSYKYLIDSHVKPELGHVKLTSLKPEHLQSLYSKKLRDGLSRRTVQYIHAVIRRALNQAVRWNLIYRNPTDAVTPPRPKKKEYTTLSAAEARAFLDSIKDHAYYPMYLIAILMGLRKSEILGLRWQDVDFEAGYLSINHTITEVQGVIHEGSPKTDSSRRSVAMPELVKQALKDIKGEGLIFTTASGRPISQRNLTRHFHNALEKAGLPRIRFHDLRHTAATLLLKENVHPKVVQEMLGHSSITLTLDQYSHVVPGMGKQAASKMDSLFKE